MQTKFKKLVDDICRQENLNHSNLSEFIYKSRNYIGRLYRDGSSDENIEKAIMLLERLGIKIEPTKLDLVKAENEMLRKQDSYRVQVLDKRNALLENAKFENEKLGNTVKHLQTVLNERNGEVSELKDRVKSQSHISGENSKLKTSNSNLLDEVAELNESVKYWSDGYAKQSNINKFMAWCILALLIVIGAVWFL